MAARRIVTPRRLLVLGGLVVAALVLMLRTQWAWDATCGVLRQELRRALKLQVEIASCQLDPLTQTVAVKGLVLQPDGQVEPVLVAEEARISLRAVQVRTWGLHLERLTVTKPKLRVDLRTPSSRPTGEGVCAARLLDRVPIDHLEIRGAQVEVLLPEERSVGVNGLDVGWTLRRGVAQFEVQARQGKIGLGPGRELMVGRLYAEGGMDLSDRNVELHRSEVVVDQANLQFTGRLDDLCEPQLALDGRLFLPVSTVARALGVTDRGGGHLWARATVSGQPDAPVALMEMRGASLHWGPHAPGDFSAQLSYRDQQLTLDHFEAQAGAGTVKLHGRMGLSKGLPARITLETQNAQFARVLEKSGMSGSWVDFPATGKGTFTGTLVPFQLAGDLELSSGAFQLATRSFDEPKSSGRKVLGFDRGRLNARVGLFADRAEFHDLVVNTGNSRLMGDAVLFYEESRGLDIAVHADPLDLSDFKEISGIAWAGRGTARCTVRGPYREVTADAQVNLRDLDFWDFSLGVVQGRVVYRDNVLAFPSLTGQKGKTQYFGGVELRFGPELYTVANLEVPSGRTEDIVELIVNLHSSIDIFQGPLKGEASASVQFDGPAERFAGRVRVDLKDTTYYGRPLGNGRVSLRFVNGEAMILDRTVLSGMAGVTTLQGSWVFAGPLDYQFRFDHGSLAQVVGVEQAKELGISGTVTMVGKVSGDSSVPVVSAYITSPNVTFATRSLGAAHLEARIQGRDFQAWGRPFADARSTLKMKLKEPFPYQATVRMALPEIRPLLPAGAISQGLSGSVAGNADLSGNFRDIKAMAMDATVDRLTLSRGDFSGQNESPVRLTYREGRLSLAALDFRGANTEFTAAGFWGPSTVDLKAAGSVDVRLLESFFPQVERTGGRVELTAAVTGTTRDPSLVGSAEARDVRLSLKSQPIALRSMSGRVEFSEARVLFQDLLGVMNDGKVRIRGDLRLANFALQRVEVGMDFEEVQFRPRDEIPLTASGALLLQGKPDAMLLGGEVEVLKMRYAQPMVLDVLLRDVKKVPSFYKGEKPREWLRFDVDVGLGNEVWVDNNLAQAKLSGKLKLTGNNLRPGLLGIIEADEGSRAYYRGNEFAVSKGEVQFKDPNGIDIFIDLNAQTQVREYLVTLKTFGRASDPKVILSAEPGLPEADILTLLTLGVTSRDTAITDRAVSGLGLAAEALLSASGLDRRVQSFLPQDLVLFRDLQMHMASSYIAATRQVEPVLILESKLLWLEELKLSMIQPWSLRGTRAQAEYRFNDRLAARAQWEGENQIYTFGNPGLDLKLRFEWE